MEGEGEEGMGEGVEVGRLSGPTRPENIPASTGETSVDVLCFSGATSVCRASLPVVRRLFDGRGGECVCGRGGLGLTLVDWQVTAGEHSG